MINNFWNLPVDNPKIIKSYEISLNDNSKENVVIYPDIILQPILEENYFNQQKKLPLEIITNLYLGDSYAYTHLPNEFKLIINCAEELKSFLPQYPSIVDLNLKLNSNDFLDSTKLLEILGIIDQFLKKNQKVLICSTFGINRSVIIICAYLMWKSKISLTEALTSIQKIYPQANPNYTLTHHLIFNKDILYNSS